jgi:hypothetical protein
MKEAEGNPDLPRRSDLFIPGAESDENNNIAGSNNDEKNFYHLPGEELFGIVDVIRNWESIRYLT